MKKLVIQILSAIMIFAFPNLSQAQVVGKCGLSPEDAKIVIQRLNDNRNNPSLNFRGAETVYIPMKYHLVQNKKGDISLDRIDKVFESICKLNEDYGEIGMVFYLKGVTESILKDVVSDKAYDDPKNFLGAAALVASKNKNNNAVNIFVTDDIGSDGQGGQVLGYYTANGDYVVMKKSEIAYNKSTLAHELGHFFTLPHTFYGWENTPYDVNNPTPKFVTYAGDQVRVEYVSQDKKTNGTKICEISADNICDTRANYKLGYGYNRCQYSGGAKDPDDVLLEPTLQEENYMSYFLLCSDYFFTEQQGERMLADYNSSNRTYLRQNYTPMTATPGDIEIYEPKADAKLSYFDLVVLDWRNVENAQYYQVEIARNRSFSKSYQTFFTTESRIELDNLVAKNTYYWRVTPFNETHFCEPSSPTISFVTGEWNTAAKNIDGLSNWYISQNPVNANEAISLVFKTSKVLKVDVSIINLDGKIVNRSKIDLIKDVNKVSLDANLSPGAYIVHLKSDNGISSKKLTVIK